MIGGGVKNMCKKVGKNNQIYYFAIGVIILLIKTFIVQWTYNQVWPKIVSNTGGDNSQFTPLTFYESLMIVILFSFLFRF